MPIETQTVDPTTGQCCDCSKQTDCNCGSGGICFGACRSRSSPNGLASFCGLAEFIPSSPPNYYYTLTLGGSGSTQCYGNAGCSGSMYSIESWEYTGSVNVSKTTCAHTSTGLLTVNGSSTFGRNDVSANDINSSGQPFGASDVFTATTHTIDVPTNPCVCNPSGFSCCPSPTGGWNSNLGDQETIDDAINRAVANQPWSNAGDCVKNSSVTTTPLPGQRDFIFKQAQVQVTVNGLPGHTYTVTIFLFSRAVGSDGPFVPYGLIEITLTQPPTGSAVSSWQDIPNVQGYTIAANGCTAVDTGA